MATKIGTIAPHSGPTGATGPVGPSGPPGGGGSGGGLSLPAQVGWTSTATYSPGAIVNRASGWLFAAVIESTGVDPFTDDGSHWQNFLIPVPPLAWVSGTTYSLYAQTVHNGALWAATSVEVTTEPATDNSDWYRVYRVVADTASVVYSGHGALPDPPPAGALDGDLYYDLDAATFTPISISGGGGAS